MKNFLKCFVLFTLIAANDQIFAQIADSPDKLADGIVVPINGTFLKVQFYAPDVVRIAYAKDRAFFARESVVTEPKIAVKTDWSLKNDNGDAVLATEKMQVHVNLASGAVSFFDADGKSILAEKSGGRAIVPAEVQGEQTFHVAQQWEANAGESLYGLGQRQIGIVDIKGYDLDLWQHNTHVVVPFLVSSRGYGILWDNLSYSRFGDLRQFEAIPTNCLMDASNQPGGLTTATFTAANPNELKNPHFDSQIVFASSGGNDRRWTRWTGEIIPATSGDYQFKTYSNGHIKMWLDGKLVIDHWRQGWLTDNDQIKVRLEAGHHYAIKIEHGGDQATTMQLTWKTPPPD